MTQPMPRQPEPEVMDLPDEATAYAAADFASVNDAFVGRLLELTGHLPGARCVDFGTGPADIPIRLLRRRPGWTVAALDASPAMLSLARTAVEQARLADAIELVLVDAKRTDRPGGSYDVVFSNSILHHIDDADALWREVARLAAPDGWIFFRDLYRPASADDARRIVREHAGEESPLLQEEFFRSLLSAYTPKEIAAQLRRTGLEALTVEVLNDRHVDISGRLAGH